MAMKIGIVGSGIAGTCAAWLLQQQGHQVTLFEQAPQFRPVGAGILLQPSGQRILQQLGIAADIQQQAATIRSLHATHRNGRTLVRLDYRQAAPHLFGLGVRRSLLFDRLLEGCRNAGVQLHEDSRIRSYRQDHQSVRLVNDAGSVTEPFDFAVAADGSRSTLRSESGLSVHVKEYADAAFWTIGPWDGNDDVLQQLVDRSGRLVGILPVGAGQCSFFWGLKLQDVDSVRDAGIDRWKQEVLKICSAAAPIVAPINHFSELTLASYRHVRLRSPIDERVVFIGDAAHATSPHLGQGTGLALEDAAVLSHSIQTHGNDVQTAFRHFARDRRTKIRFYSALTGTLTPFFQTGNRLLQTGRNLALPVMPRLPWIGTQMALTMAGLKSGWLTDQRPA